MGRDGRHASAAAGWDAPSPASLLCTTHLRCRAWENIWVPPPGSHAHPLGAAGAEGARTGSFCFRGGGGGNRTPPTTTTHEGRRASLSGEIRGYYRAGWLPKSPKPTNAHCRCYYLNPGEKAEASPRDQGQKSCGMEEGCRLGFPTSSLCRGHSDLRKLRGVVRKPPLILSVTLSKQLHLSERLL